MVNQGNVRLEKSPFRELFIGEIFIGEMSVRKVVSWGNVLGKPVPCTWGVSFTLNFGASSLEFDMEIV